MRYAGKILAVLTIVTAAPPVKLVAQEVQTATPASLVGDFRNRVDSGGGPPQEIVDVMLYPERSPVGYAEAVADGLKQLVLNGEGTARTRSAAVTLIAKSRSPSHDGPLHGTVDRLSDMYWGSEDPGVRSQVVYLAINVPDQRSVATFLSDVARSDSDIAVPAVKLLEMLGPPGLDALRELADGPSPDNPEVRAYLARRSSEGFAPKAKHQPRG